MVGNTVLLAIFIMLTAIEVVISVQHWQRQVRSVTVIHKDQHRLIDYEGR